MINDNKPIYDRWCQELIHSPRNLTSEADRLDQAALEAHIRRMGNATVFRVGYSSAILRGKIEKLDPDDYSKCAEDAFRVFADPQYGEWYGYLRRDGKPTEPPCKGSTYKGPFHLPRMLMTVDTLLSKFV